MINLYTIEFEVPLVSFIFNIILLVVYNRKKKLQSVQNNLFKYILVSTILSSFIDLFLHILCAFLGYDYISTNLYQLFNWSNKFLIVFFAIIFESLFTYTNVISYGEESVRNRYLNFFLIFSNVILLLVLPFTNIELINLGKVVNVSGTTPSFGYSFIALYLLLCIVITIINYKKIDRKYLPIIVIFVSLIISFGLTIFISELILYDFVFTILIYLMYFTIENPDAQLLYELYKSKEISDNANDEKNLFIYNMTQESRKVTSNINLYAEEILSSDNIEEVKDYARNILNESAKYAGITYDILGVDSVTTGDFKVYKTKYNLKNIIKEIVTINENKCTKKEIIFRTNIDHNIPNMLYGDSIKLKEIINELIDYNTLKEETKYLDLNVSVLIKESVCRLFITIDNPSFGMSSEDLNKELNNKNTLSEINHHIIKMNGAMSITSNVATGTSYKIILDQVIEQEETEIKKYEKIFNNQKILIVDDSDASLKIFEKIFIGTNIILDTCKNGKECLEKIKNKNKYDLILIDEELDDELGKNILDKLKNIRNFNIKTILLTKNNNNEYTEDYKKDGFDDYLLKPIKKEELISKINNYK